jgi:hypothetical protein
VFLDTEIKFPMPSTGGNSLPDLSGGTSSGPADTPTAGAKIESQVSADAVCSQRQTLRIRNRPDGEELPQYVERPLPIITTSFFNEAAWSTTHDLGGPLSLILAAAASQPVNALYRCLRCTVNLRIQTSGNPHMYGVAGFALLKSSDMRGLISPARMVTLDCSGTLSVNDSKPLDLCFPFFHYFDRLNAQDATQVLNYVNLKQFTVAPPGRDDGVAFTSPNILIYGWLSDVEWTDTSMFVTASGEASTMNGKSVPIVSTGFGLLSSVIRKFGGPQWASTLASSVGGMSAALGYARPVADLNFVRMIDRNGIMASSAGTDTVVRLDPDPTSGVPVIDPTIGGEPYDVMDYSAFFSRWGVVASFSYPTSATAGTLLASIPVSPNVAYTDPNGLINPLPMSVPASFNTLWTGSVEYHIAVNATAFHRGKLIMVHNPTRLTAATSSIATMLAKGHACVIDLANNTSVTVSVGWAQDIPFLPIYAFAENETLINPIPGIAYNFMFSGASATSISNRFYSNGAFDIYVMDPLIATSAGANLVVNVYARGGKDMQFHGPQNQAIQTFCMASGMALTDATVNYKTVDDVCKLSGSLMPPGVFKTHFGSQLKSFRALMHRYSPVYAINTCSSGNPITIVEDLSFEIPAYPPIRKNGYNNIFQAFTTTSGTAHGNGGSLLLVGSLFGYLPAFFYGCRGSTRHKFVVEGTTVPVTINVAAYAASMDSNVASLFSTSTNTGLGPVWANDETAPVGGSSFPTIYALQTSALGSYDIQYNTHRIGADFELPNSSMGKYYAANIDTSVTYISPGARVTVTSTTVGNSVSITDHMSIGEDYALLGWAGVPPVTAQLANFLALPTLSY